MTHSARLQKNGLGQTKMLSTGNEVSYFIGTCCEGDPVASGDRNGVPRSRQVFLPLCYL